MLSLEFHRGDADREPEVVLCFDSRGAEALIGAVRKLVDQGKDAHDHLATTAPSGTEPDESSLGPSATPLKHLQLVFRSAGLATAFVQHLP